MENKPTTLEIRNRWDNSPIFAHTQERNTWKETVLAALAADANLSDANLSGANLSDANLRGADLSDANLSDANLRGANLRGADLSDANLSDANLSGANLSDANLSDANLSDANLSDANLRGANLRGADLSDANLSDANLSGANLSDANLSGANLSGANLSDANLRHIKHDLFGVLLYAQAEVPAMLTALKEGKVDGSTYSGACACLVGTICNVRGVNPELSAERLHIPKDSDSYIERWFMGIRPGHTPENSNQVKLTVEWVEEFLALTTTPDRRNIRLKSSATAGGG